MTDKPDQHRDHVTTIPTAGVAPEYHHYPVNKEPGANVQGDDINIPLVVASVAVSAILLTVTVIFLQAWYYDSMADETEAAMAPYAPLIKMRADQQEQLNTARWLKEPSGFMAIPIDKAIDLTVAQCNAPGTEGSK